MDLREAQPLEGVVHAHREDTVVSVFGVKDRDFSIYIADAREFGDDRAGQDIQGDLTFTVPDGDYEIGYFSPTEGNWFGTEQGPGGEVHLSIRPFAHDVVVRVRKSPRQ